MRLFDLLKDKLKDPVGVVSDGEMCLLNRRDFLYSETSQAQALLAMFGRERVSYEMYSLVDVVFAMFAQLEGVDQVDIFQLSDSMTLATLAGVAAVGDRTRTLRIFAPRGNQPVSAKCAFGKSLLDKLAACTTSEVPPVPKKALQLKTLNAVLCNASSEADVLAAINVFAERGHGFLLVKGYARHGAPNVGEFMLKNRLFFHCNLAGYALAVNFGRGNS